MGVERGPAVVRRRTQSGCMWGALLACCFFLLPALTGISPNMFFFAWVVVVAYWKVFLPARRGVRAARANRRRPASTSLAELHELALETGGGAYLATGERGELLFAPPEAAVLVLAGPRAGKTSCVVIPQILAHPGPVLATSTKPEVLQATLSARRQLGNAWFFDLQGRGAPAGTRPLRWSPVQGAQDWQRAQLVAEAMAGAAEIDKDGAHWRERAAALIACCLHGAARSGLGMREVIAWVLRHDPAAPLEELEPGLMAVDVLEGIKHTGERERASIFSTAARVLRAYRSEIALGASDQPNFDPDAFAASADTVYIAASGPEQRLLAPLVAGLVTDVARGPLPPPLEARTRWPAAAFGLG
jgi:type IV secretory pathway TraG/TraD family ATPase VirD4